MKEGDICSWYPGESDYPSIVELIERFKLQPEGIWVVNYAIEPIEENWLVEENELFLRESK